MVLIGTGHPPKTPRSHLSRLGTVRVQERGEKTPVTHSAGLAAGTASNTTTIGTPSVSTQPKPAPMSTL